MEDLNQKFSEINPADSGIKQDGLTGNLLNDGSAGKNENDSKNEDLSDIYEDDSKSDVDKFFKDYGIKNKDFSAAEITAGESDDVIEQGKTVLVFKPHWLLIFAVTGLVLYSNYKNGLSMDISLSRAFYCCIGAWVIVEVMDWILYKMK